MDLGFVDREPEAPRPGRMLPRGQMEVGRKLKRIAYVVRPLVLLGRGIKVVQYWRDDQKCMDGCEISRIGSNPLNRNCDQQELNATKT